MLFPLPAHWHIYALIILALNSFSFSAFAAADKVPREQPPPTAVDRTHQTISTSLAAPSRWFDSFFADPRKEEELAGTYLRLRGSVILDERDGIGFDGDTKVRLRLPRMKRRFHLVLSSEEDDVRDGTLRDARSNRELAAQNEKTTLALEYTQERSSKFSLIHRAGMDLEAGLNPNIRSRVRYLLPIAEQSLLNFTQVLFWEKVDGFGEESRIDYDIPFTENMLLRATGQGLFSESSNGYEWLVMLQWLASFSHKKAINVGAFAEGETRPQNHVTEYNLFVRYRQKFIKKWFFFELKPELYWPQESDYSITTAFTLTLEVQFGE